MKLATKILKKLEAMYPDAHCELYHQGPYQLLVATILSAQCTDKRVNMVTPPLFKAAPTPKAMLELGEKRLMAIIKSCGFYRTKAKNILKTSQLLLEKFGGEVPRTQEELIQLPSVGRKTANVVLYNAYGIAAIAVDTHVFRVSQRLGLAKGKTPEQIEQQLMKVFAKQDWGKAHHLLIFHGRYHCSARRPKCETCPLTTECQYYQTL